MIPFSEQIFNRYQLPSHFPHMKVLLMKILAQNFVKMKDNTDWHNKQKHGKLSHNILKHYRKKHTNCRPLDIKTVSYYENR